MTTVITADLLSMIRRGYRLNWYGTHGVIHWSRVYDNGVKLAEQDGVNIRVVQLFSIFHDSRRRNESSDKEHGRRGANLAVTLREYVPLNDADFSLLITACELHTSAVTHENMTVQACFDSDRLDLGRVGIIPDPKYLCTPLAKKQEIIEWACKRSLHHELPKQPFGMMDRVFPVAGDRGTAMR